jgi:hypothetical protein
MSEELELFDAINGVRGDTGDYLLPAVRISDLARAAKGEALDADTLAELEGKSQAAFPVDGNPLLLQDVGWGVIFAFDDPQAAAIREALAPLLDLRRRQCPGQAPAPGQLGERGHYREFSGVDAYRPGQRKNDFLARFNIGPGLVEPRKIPYYLLIVGSPELIPYRFQFELDVQFAVGRIHFDSLDDYAAYAHNVVRAETSAPPPRKAVLFGVNTPGDRATELSTKHLIQPLATDLRVANEAGVLQQPWQIATLLGEDQATRAKLERLLGGDLTPSVLLTASHGVGFGRGEARQRRQQGALLCQDWPGPIKHRGPLPEDFYFAGDHLSASADLKGMLAFFFACYGAGTPLLDEFAHNTGARVEIAEQAFLGYLPQRMLCHPRGALAVIGHVERAWGYSFIWAQAAQTLVFQRSLQHMMQGGRIGWVMEDFNLRYAELATMLSNELEEAKFGAANTRRLGELWTAHADARNYIIVGDPAVRLRYDDIGIDQTGAGSVSSITAGPAPVVGESAPAAAALVAEPEPEPAPAVSEVAPDAGSESFLLNFGKHSEVADQMGAALQDFGQKLARAFHDLSSLEVQTYSSRDLAGVSYAEGKFTGPVHLRALTRISLDGDTLICLPEDENGLIDREVWDLHEAMVTRAQQHRAQMITTAAEAMASLLRALRGG